MNVLNPASLAELWEKSEPIKPGINANHIQDTVTLDPDEDIYPHAGLHGQPFPAPIPAAVHWINLYFTLGTDP